MQALDARVETYIHMCEIHLHIDICEHRLCVEQNRKINKGKENADAIGRHGLQKPDVNEPDVCMILKRESL